MAGSSGGGTATHDVPGGAVFADTHRANLVVFYPFVELCYLLLLLQFDGFVTLGLLAVGSVERAYVL